MVIALIPRKILKKIGDPQRAYAMNVLISAFVVLLLLYAYKTFFGLFSEFNFCLFQRLLGIPCPGCGMSRSLFALYEFRIVDSFMLNPCGTPFLLNVILQIPLAALFLGRKLSHAALFKFNRLCTVLIICGLCAVWFARLFFPSLLTPLT